MKKLLVALMFIAVVAFAANASASVSLSLSPTGAQSGNTNGQSISIDVFLTADTTYSVDGANIIFDVNPAQINASAASATWFTGALGDLGTAYMPSFFGSGDDAIAIQAATGVNQHYSLATGATKIATISGLTLVNPVVNGTADIFAVLSDPDDFADGLLLANGSPVILNQANGADYAAAAPAVPVPGAVWLLGTGLLGLIGLRRRG